MAPADRSAVSVASGRIAIAEELLRFRIAILILNIEI